MLVAVPLSVVLVGTSTAVPPGRSHTGGNQPPAHSGTPAVESRVKDTMEVGGERFRDLDDNGRLGSYENWRLPAKVRAADLDPSVTFLLTEMFKLGLFGHPYVDPQRAHAVADDPESQAEADKAHRSPSCCCAMIRTCC